MRRIGTQPGDRRTWFDSQNLAGCRRVVTRRCMEIRLYLTR
jgi:hypothetical protein